MVDLDDGFAAAAGYDLGGAPTHVRFAAGVDVRVGLPRRLHRTPA